MTTFVNPADPAPVAAPRVIDAVPRTLITPRNAPAIEQRLAWQRRYRARLALTDTLVVLVSAGVAAWIQIAGVAKVDLADAPWQYGRVFVITFLIWSLMLVLFQTRDPRVLGQGTTEYRRVAHATGLAFGMLASGFVILQSQGIRTQLLIALPLGMAGMLLGRWTSRQWLIRQRRVGEFLSRAIVVGNRSDVEYVVRSVNANGLIGYRIVGITLTDEVQMNDALTVGEQAFTSIGTADTAAIVAAQLNADAVIVASTPSDNDYLKRLSWQLEGTASELVLSSPLADVAGPRMSLRPVEGLPLVQVEIPTFEGSRYALKRAMDIALSSLALVVVAVLTPVIAIAIKLDDGGPVFFAQERVGRDGQVFRMWKFRSMRTDAESAKHGLADQNHHTGPMFKIRRDPRITRVGALMRKYSIDELPQFLNVLIGDMSIVGPRPPLPSEVTSYDGTVYRRLYIKPGITGLWQISGRSDLDWEETVRLDLRYVENWSVIGDLVILWRTVGTVLRAHGAY
ncbi:sugar transferase [Microbacterium kyungheense]|uniref:Exopolysaccharide biosynthesis polyprenyl glycosylphosphotransferase n=1 Tax=Microbacterium kyungheense TaxID=1263636 RepID=A0A543ERS3_9MICO|nr:sugar transferase [Microbacterium kyungheense]TQM24278.1 exopolysaccharide biosynthesis polyprenyl glycosylphosphotransferase [Microbacterium kyungheense]